MMMLMMIDDALLMQVSRFYERERESRRKNSLRGLDSNCLEARVRVKGRTVPGDASRNWIMIS